MMLVSIEPARTRGVDLHTFECAVCNQVLATFAAFEDPTKSKGPDAGFKAICTQREGPSRSHWRDWGTRPRKPRASPAGLPRAVRALRSDVVRRAASRGGTLRCAEAHALPTLMSISPTRLVDYTNMAGREATSRQRCCRSRHLFRSRRKSRDCWNGM